jgi:hypothetical protein
MLCYAAPPRMTMPRLSPALLAWDTIVHSGNNIEASYVNFRIDSISNLVISNILNIYIISTILLIFILIAVRFARLVIAKLAHGTRFGQEFPYKFA